MDFLNLDDLMAYTGYKRPSDQIRQLIKMGVPHDLDRLNRPVVLKSTIANRLSGSQNAKPYDMKKRINRTALN